MPHPRPSLRVLLAMAVLLLLASGLVTPGAATPAGAIVDAQVQSHLQRARGDVERLLPITDRGEARPASRAKPSRAVPYRRSFPRVARRAAQAAGIRDPELFVRQIAAESAYEPCVSSSAGAIGIAQIMPTTADSWQVDPHDPDAALAEAARRMATYERQLGNYRLALAAYNAGPNAVRRYRGVPPYPETRAYISLIMDKRRTLSSMKKVYSLPSGLTPQFERRLRALQRAVAARGSRLMITDGWRSYVEQRRLWRDARSRHGGFRKASLWVAPPGCSNHNRGVAADLRGNLVLAHRLAPEHGLVFPMDREPWHVELAGIETQSR